MPPSFSLSLSNTRTHSLFLSLLSTRLFKYYDPLELEQLIKSSRKFLTDLSKAKGGQLLKTLLDAFLSIKDAADAQVAVIQDSIAWANEEKRAFLRQALEVHIPPRPDKCTIHCGSLTTGIRSASSSFTWTHPSTNSASNTHNLW